MNLLNNLPEEYKKVILSGYSSIILLFLLNLRTISIKRKYEVINGFGGPLSLGLFVIAAISFLYFYLRTPTVKEYYTRQVVIKENVMKHTILIEILFITLLCIYGNLTTSTIH